MKNLEVIEKVKDKGQGFITTRWVNTRKEAHDGQKTDVKSHLLARGFQDLDKYGLKPQSDIPTAQKEALNIGIEKLRSIDITTAFLQSNVLDHEIFVKHPKMEDGRWNLVAFAKTTVWFM